MQDPYAIYFTALLGGVILLTVGVAGPLTTSPFLANLWVRGSIFAIGVVCYFVMKNSLAAIRPDKHAMIYLTVTSGTFAIILAVNGMVTAFGVVRYLCTPLDVAADERELEESRQREGDPDEEYSQWDRKYQQKRRGD